MPSRKVNLVGRLEALCERYLGHHPENVEIIWDDWPSPNTWAYGYFTFDEDDEPIILLNPVLQLSWVPMFVLDATIYHEGCHWYLWMKTGELGEDHGPEFNVLEVLYPKYAESAAWSRKNEERLTRAIARQQKKRASKKALDRVGRNKRVATHSMQMPGSSTRLPSGSLKPPTGK